MDLQSPGRRGGRGLAACGADRDLDELLQLGRIGYVRGIEAKLKEWEAAEPEAATFIAGLRRMVRQFELKKYMEVLEAIQRHE